MAGLKRQNNGNCGWVCIGFNPLMAGLKHKEIQAVEKEFSRFNPLMAGLKLRFPTLRALLKDVSIPLWRGLN